MDALIYLKDTIRQPNGDFGEVLKNDIFDFHLVTSTGRVGEADFETIFSQSKYDMYSDETITLYGAEYNEETEEIELGSDYTLGELNAKFIDNVELIDNFEEIKQSCLFAALKQRGSDPLAPEEGVRWSEAYLGEIPSELLMIDIQNAVKSVSSVVAVQFDTITDANGNEFLTFELKLPKGDINGD